MPEKSRQHDRREETAELETQFILRMPEEPSKALREAIQSGSNNLKDRFFIRLENDVRYGEVRLDHWLMHAKVVDLPTVMESLKTIDNKSFYKSADICQMMICKYEPDAPSADEESPNKNKKKDPTKVDKKYLWPHGITPPAKNIRKRRFRKTLKKKYVEAPEIEKEVKRLLRVDNEAVNVKHEILNEEDENKATSPSHLGVGSSNDHEKSGTLSKSKSGRGGSGISGDAKTSGLMEYSQGTSRDVGEHDIFGEAVSSSDDEQENINVMETELDETSRLSADDSRLSDSNSMHGQSQHQGRLLTEFNKSMFGSPRSRKSSSNIGGDFTQSGERDPVAGSSRGFYERGGGADSDDMDFGEPQMSQETANRRIVELKHHLTELRTQRIQKEQEIASIENPTLRQRMQDTLDNLLSQMVEKEMEIHDLQTVYDIK